MGIVSESDSKILNKLAKECREPVERERLRSLYILSMGYSVKDVSRMFSVDEDTIYRWAERWNEERSVADLERSGRPPSLGEDEKKEMKRLIDESDVLTSDPYSAGVESRGEGKGFLGSAFFSVFHCIAFLLTSTGFSTDFLYSLGVIYSSEECGLFSL